MQELSATEEQFYPGRVNWQYLLSMDSEDVDTEQQRAHDFFYKPVFHEMMGMYIYICLRSRPIYPKVVRGLVYLVQNLTN